MYLFIFPQGLGINNAEDTFIILPVPFHEGVKTMWQDEFRHYTKVYLSRCLYEKTVTFKTLSKVNG